MPRKKKETDGKEEKTEEKEKVKEEKDKAKEEREENFLVPLDEYKKSGISLGTKIITPFMERYVFKRRPDGLATINTNETDEKLRKAINLLSKYNPDEIVIACKRESGWKGLELLGELTGIKVFTKKYPSGVMTNINLPDFFEPSILFIADPWIDKAILSDAVKLNLPVISLCDTNNTTQNIDFIVPCNNKSSKSIGLIFYIIARELKKIWKMDFNLPDINDFVGAEA